MDDVRPALAERHIAHLDMDAFYASVELLRYPELKGEPVVIGGGRRHEPEMREGVRHFARLKDYVGRGVITTATYPARAFGVNSGLGLMKAAKLCPQAILLPVDFDQYRHFSRLFKAAVRAIAPTVEDRGIDEIYIDLSHADVPRELAAQLKAAVHAATGLTCSVGLAPNKLLAKMCSELEKPNGLTVLQLADIPTRIWPLAARKINGIGPKAETKLASLGIHTIGELAAFDPQALLAHFGKSYGAWLHEAAHGRDEREVVTYSEPKSISRETTFDRNLHAVRDRAELSAIFTELAEQLASDLSRKGYLSKTIGIKLRFEDFSLATRDNTIEIPTDDAKAIRHAAGVCLKRVELTKRLRLLGVRAGSLIKRSEYVAHAPSAPLAVQEPMLFYDN
jgi:DNA polymerase IV